MQKLRIGLAITVALLIGLAQIGTAQEGAITWIVEYTVEEGQAANLVDEIRDFWGPVTREQIDAGNIFGWGIAEVTNYVDGPTHVEWLNFPSWQAVAEVDRAFSEKVAASGDSPRRISELLEARATHGVSRSVFRTYAGSIEDFRYFVLAEWVARPGLASAGTRLWLDEAQPHLPGLDGRRCDRRVRPRRTSPPRLRVDALLLVRHVGSLGNGPRTGRPRRGDRR